MKRIIFKNTDNSIGVIIPSQEVMSKYTLVQIANKDVPAGLPYKIVNTSDVPSDRTFRDAWEWDDTVEPDGVGSIFNTFEEIE